MNIGFFGVRSTKGEVFMLGFGVRVGEQGVKGKPIREMSIC
jgi:hypothetical protein